jgi:hypothetical protein
VADTAVRTPLLDLFRRGDVSDDIRLLAAQGALAPRAHEQLEILMLLVHDDDATIAATAESTLDALPRSALRSFLARTDVSQEVRAFFRGRGVEPASTEAPHEEAALVDARPAGEPQEEAGETRESIVQRIATMNVPQRVELAMKGSREARAILVRDPNKVVSAAVLSSPRLTESEVEAIARMANVTEDVLRIIAGTRAWMKNYAVASALARNPKTPVALSMNLLARLTERDVKSLSTDRNVPDVLRTAARRKLVLDDNRRIRG